MSAPALIDTTSGEVLELTRLDLATWAPAELASLRDRLGDVKRAIDSVLANVDTELVAELDRDNARSGRFGEWLVTVPAPYETVWDTPRLGIALEALVRADKITRHAAAAALEPVTTYKPRARELAKLLAHADPEVTAAVDACRHAEPKARRYARVERATPTKPRLEGAHTAQEGPP